MENLDQSLRDKILDMQVSQIEDYSSVASDSLYSLELTGKSPNIREYPSSSGYQGFTITLDRDFSTRALRYTLKKQDFHELREQSDEILSSHGLPIPQLARPTYDFLKFFGERNNGVRSFQNCTGLIRACTAKQGKGLPSFNLQMNPQNLNTLQYPTPTVVVYSTFNVNDPNQSQALLEIWKNWFEFMKTRI